MYIYCTFRTCIYIYIFMYKPCERLLVFACACMYMYIVVCNNQGSLTPSYIGHTKWLRLNTIQYRALLRPSWWGRMHVWEHTALCCCWILTLLCLLHRSSWLTDGEYLTLRHTSISVPIYIYIYIYIYIRIYAFKKSFIHTFEMAFMHTMGFRYEVFMAFLDTSCYGLRTWLQGCMLACSHTVMCCPLVTVTVTVTVRRYTQLDRCKHEQTNTCAIAEYCANAIRHLEGHSHGQGHGHSHCHGHGHGHGQVTLYKRTDACINKPTHAHCSVLWEPIQHMSG
jgi:hypothetical protein